MREWFGDAACAGQDGLMHDRDQVAVAVDLCRTCPVITDCTAYYEGMPYRPQHGVAHGHDYGTVRGKRRVRVTVERKCVMCGRVFRVERGSTVSWCSVGCSADRSTVLGDVSELGRIARLFLDTT